jgi:hypothetical protein
MLESLAEDARNEHLLTVGVAVVAALAAGVVVARRRSARQDLGVALVELFAAVADLLSAYQDAVAEEGYLRGRCRSSC